MKIIKIEDLNHQNPEALQAAGQALNQGQVVILPTSTIYGLSCLYNNRQALQEIYRLKNRNQSMPLILLVSTRSQLETLIENPNPEAKKLMDICWFSKNILPVTLILNKNNQLPEYITASSPHIAIRRPQSAFLLKLIEQTGPITSTSATISGSKIYPDRVKDIPESIRDNVFLIIQSEQKLAGTESTIINITTSHPSLVREGVVKYKDIINLLGNKYNGN